MATPEERPYRYIPAICRDYNNGACTRDNCTHPHVCFNFFDPNVFCKLGRGCEFNHDITFPQVRYCLVKAGFNVNVTPKALRDVYVQALKIRKRDTREPGQGRDSSRGPQGTGQGRDARGPQGPGHGTGGLLKEVSQILSAMHLNDVPQVCLNYNSGLCSTAKCPLLHLCADYINMECKNSYKDCPHSHDINSPPIKARLRDCGFNVDRKPSEVLENYRAALKVLLAIGGGEVKRAHFVEDSDRPTRNSANSRGRGGNFARGRGRGGRPPRMGPREKSSSLVNLGPQPLMALPVDESVNAANTRGRGGRPSRMGQAQKEKSSSVVDLTDQPLSSIDLTNEVPVPNKVPRKRKPRIRKPKPAKETLPLVSSSSGDSSDDSSVYSGCDESASDEEPSGKGDKIDNQNVKRRGKRGGKDRKKGKSEKEWATQPAPKVQQAQETAEASSTSGSKRDPQKQHISIADDADICLYFLNGKCTYKDSCKNHHLDLPYHWQYKVLQQGWKWKSFPKDAIQLLEQSFCNVDISSCSVIIEGQMFTVEFDSMKACSKEINVPVRRLSTTSFVNEPEDQSFVTQWCWYWDSDAGWVECGQKDSQSPKKGVDSIRRNLEEGFQNPGEEMTIRINRYPYSIDFEKMRQKNTTSKTERSLRRRPTYVSPDDVKNTPRLQKLARQKAKELNRDVNLPTNWEPMSDEDEIRLVSVSTDSEEYVGIKVRFQEAMPKSKLLVVQRIQNPTLWFTFSWKKSKMEKVYGAGNTNEMRLFHGTSPEAVNPICQQNFDWRLYGSAVGARYGKGAYFTKDASRADQYVKADDKGLRYMFGARVLVGRFTKGEKTMRRPPPVDEADPYKLYDSCVNDPKDPMIFVLFDKEQYYPEYIICYKY